VRDSRFDIVHYVKEVGHSFKLYGLIAMGKFFDSATTEEYVEAFLSSRSEISDKQLEVLRAQYAAPDKTVTASELAEAVGYDHFLPANSLYGSIGHLIADELGRKPKKQTKQFKHWWSVLSTGESGSDGFEWTMRLQVAEALEKLSWVEPDYQQLTEGEETEEVETVARKLFPEKEIRSVCLKVFAASINHADILGSGKWGVYFKENKIRLLVGNLIVCTAHENTLWMTLDADGLNASKDKRRLLSRSEGWEWDSGDYSKFSAVPSRNGYYSHIVRAKMYSAQLRSYTIHTYIEWLINIAD